MSVLLKTTLIRSPIREKEGANVVRIMRMLEKVMQEIVGLLWMVSSHTTTTVTE